MSPRSRVSPERTRVPGRRGWPCHASLVHFRDAVAWVGGYYFILGQLLSLLLSLSLSLLPLRPLSDGGMSHRASRLVSIGAALCTPYPAVPCTSPLMLRLYNQYTATLIVGVPRSEIQFASTKSPVLTLLSYARWSALLCTSQCRESSLETAR